MAGRELADPNKRPIGAVCRLATLSLETGSSSPAMARRFVVAQLEHWELSQLSEVAALLTSELVTNAIVHGKDDSVVAVTAAVIDGFLEVGVSDHGTVPPEGLHAKAGALEATHARAERGRGLAIVEKLADDWGTAPFTGGKLVWFRLGADSWSYLSACRCEDPSFDRVHLESGSFVAKLAGPCDLA